MKIVLYYFAINPTGNSAAIVARLATKAKFSFDYKNVLDNPDIEQIVNYDHIVFLVATYGDQELQDNIEKFVLSIKQDLSGKKFSICELGNYYGYDDYVLGAGQIVGKHLESRNAQMHLRTYSIDTLPKMDWWAIDSWIESLNREFQETTNLIHQ